MIPFATVLGMDSSDFKDVAIAVVGAVVLYFQYRINQKAHEAKTEAVNTKTELGGKIDTVQTEAASTKVELSKKLDTVESNVNGKMSLLLTEHGMIKKQEGVEAGRTQAQAEASAMQTAVTAAAPAIAAAVFAASAPPVTPPTSEPDKEKPNGNGT